MLMSAVPRVDDAADQSAGLVDLANMKVVDLRAELQKRGKLTSGRKGVLVKRLRESIAASTAPASTSPPTSTTSGGLSSAMEIDEGGGEGDDDEGSELKLPRVDAATTFTMKQVTATLSPAADEETWAVLHVAKYGVEKEYEIQAIATGRKSEAWIRKLLGLPFNGEDYNSSTKFTFALEVIHDGNSVAKSAGFELRPDAENKTCTVEIDKVATFHDLKNLGHGRATVFAMVLAAGALAMKLFNFPVTRSTIAVSNSGAKAFYSHIGYQKDRGLEHGGLGGAFLVPVVISGVEEEPEVPTTAAAEAPADSAGDDREEAKAAGSAAPAEAGTDGRNQQGSSTQIRAEQLKERLEWLLEELNKLPDLSDPPDSAELRHEKWWGNSCHLHTLLAKVYSIIESGHRNIFEKTAHGSALLAIYEAAKKKDRGLVSSAARSFINGSSACDRGAILSGAGWGKHSERSGSVCSLEGLLCRIFNIHDDAQQDANTDCPRFFDFSDVSREECIVGECKNCGRIDVNVEKHMGVNSLRGSPSVSRVLEIDPLQCTQCSRPEFGLVVNHTDVDRYAFETPNVILFETTRDKRGTYGLPAEFEVELMINFCEQEYFLVDISFYQPGHYISQSLRLNANSELRWYQRDDLRDGKDPSVPNTALAPEISPPTTRKLMEMQQRRNTSVSNLTYVKKTEVLQRYAEEYCLASRPPLPPTPPTPPPPPPPKTKPAAPAKPANTTTTPSPLKPRLPPVPPLPTAIPRPNLKSFQNLHSAKCQRIHFGKYGIRGKNPYGTPLGTVMNKDMKYLTDFVLKKKKDGTANFLQFHELLSAPRGSAEAEAYAKKNSQYANLWEALKVIGADDTRIGEPLASLEESYRQSIDGFDGGPSRRWEQLNSTDHKAAVTSLKAQFSVYSADGTLGIDVGAGDMRVTGIDSEGSISSHNRTATEANGAVAVSIGDRILEVNGASVSVDNGDKFTSPFQKYLSLLKNATGAGRAVNITFSRGPGVGEAAATINASSLSGAWRSSLGDSIAVVGKAVSFTGGAVGDEQALSNSTTLMLGGWSLRSLRGGIGVWEKGGKEVVWKRLVLPKDADDLIDQASAPASSSTAVAAALATMNPVSKGDGSSRLFSVFQPGAKYTSDPKAKTAADLDPPEQCGYCSKDHWYTSKQGLSKHRATCYDFKMSGGIVEPRKGRGRRSLREQNFGDAFMTMTRKRVPPRQAAKYPADSVLSASSLIARNEREGRKLSLKVGEVGKMYLLLTHFSLKNTFEKISEKEDLARSEEDAPYIPTRLESGDVASYRADIAANFQPLVRTVWGFLVGAGSGKLHELGGACHRPQDQWLIDVRAPYRNPTQYEAQTAFFKEVLAELGDGRWRGWTGTLVRHPKIPIFQERCGALAPGSCPSSYCVEPIILWDPFTFFPDFKTRKACRHCNSTSIIDNWWTDGKCVEGIESTYRKYAKRMKCNACGKASQSDDDFTIDLFPPFVRTFYELHCGTFTHKHGVSWASSSTVRYFAGSQESISGVPKLKREIRGDLYVKSLRLFAEYDDWDRRNPAIGTIIANQNVDGKSVLTGILERPFQPFSPEQFGVPTASRQYFETVFKKDMQKRGTYYRRHQANIRALAIMIDSTFAVPSKYITHRGDRRLKAISTVMTDTSQIVSQAPISGVHGTSDGMVGDLSSVEPMFACLAKLGLDPQMANTDNCCDFGGDKFVLEKHFGLVDITDAGSGGGAPNYSRIFPEEGVVTRVVSVDETNRVIGNLLKSRVRAVGFDMEWYWLPEQDDGDGNRKQRRAALIQVAYDDVSTGTAKCILIHLAQFPSWRSRKLKALPPALLQLLYSKKIEKMGVNISGDMKKLNRDYDIDLGQCSRCTNLEDYAKALHKPLRNRRWGLASLMSFFLQTEMEKKLSLRMSNWEQVLSDDQESYAVDDAYASFLLGDAISAYEFTEEGLPDDGSADAGGGGGIDDDDDEVFQPSVGKGSGLLTDEEKRQRAMQIDQEGFDMDSDIVQSPPVSDENFVERLNEERQKGFLCSRVKVDSFHWMKRYGRSMKKRHPLFGIFHGCLRDAVFLLNPDDVKARRAMMVAKGLVSKEGAERIPKSVFTKRGRARRMILSRLELAVRVQVVFELFVGLTDMNGEPLITEKTHETHRKCMEHIWKGCLSDIPGLQMYREQRKRDKDGMASSFMTIRGTSHLEGYHRWLKACISGSQLSPDLFRDLLAHFNYRWNIRCGVRNIGDRDYSTYSRWEVEAILNVVEGRAIEGELFPGFERAMPAAKLLSLGVNVDEIGYHMPPDASFGSGRDNDDDDEDGDVEGGGDSDDDDDDDDDDDGDPVDELSPKDISLLSGAASQQSIVAFGPVRSLEEIKLVLELVQNSLKNDIVPKKRKKKKPKQLRHTIDHEKLASLFNAELKRRRDADHNQFIASRMTLKKKAHISDYFKRADEGLQLEAALAGVKDKFIRVRRMLKTSSSEAVFPDAIPVATSSNRGSCCPSGSSSDSSDSSGSGDDDSDSDSDSDSGDSDSDSGDSDSDSPTADSKKRKRRPKMCPGCSAFGIRSLKVRVRGKGVGNRWKCENEDDNGECPGAKRQKK